MKAAVVMGSDSDLPIMKETISTLDYFDVESLVSVTSAHRTPDKAREFIVKAEKQGCEVIIAGAGMSAHLAGVMAAHTNLPVIGVPMKGGALNGVAALYSMVQMPRGVPVATLAIGKAGAVNAGILAVQILAIKYDGLKKKLAEYKKDLAKSTESIDEKLQKSGVDKYLEEKK